MELPCPFTDKYRFEQVDELVAALTRYFGTSFRFKVIEPIWWQGWAGWAGGRMDPSMNAGAEPCQPRLH